jgi:hypothetical protein
MGAVTKGQSRRATPLVTKLGGLITLDALIL